MYGHPDLVAVQAFIYKPKEQSMSNGNCSKDSPFFRIFGEPVHNDCRAQAIADGVLVDLMKGETLEVCQQHFKHPIACTAAVYELMALAVSNHLYMNSYAGILEELLHMSKVYSFNKNNAPLVEFRAVIQGAGRQRYYDFKLRTGPGDNMEPVITLMLYNES